jgi:hypothetical protein
VETKEEKRLRRRTTRRTTGTTTRSESGGDDGGGGGGDGNEKDTRSRSPRRINSSVTTRERYRDPHHRPDDPTTAENKSTTNHITTTNKEEEEEELGISSPRHHHHHHRHQRQQDGLGSNSSHRPTRRPQPDGLGSNSSHRPRRPQQDELALSCHRPETRPYQPSTTTSSSSIRSTAVDPSSPPAAIPQPNFFDTAKRRSSVGRLLETFQAMQSDFDKDFLQLVDQLQMEKQQQYQQQQSANKSGTEDSNNNNTLWPSLEDFSEEIGTSLQNLTLQIADVGDEVQETNTKLIKKLWKHVKRAGQLIETALFDDEDLSETTGATEDEAGLLQAFYNESNDGPTNEEETSTPQPSLHI